jgi:flagellar basal body-associated protein FliL
MSIAETAKGVKGVCRLKGNVGLLVNTVRFLYNLCMRFRVTTVLSTVLFILLGVILLGTGIAFATNNARPGAGLRRNEQMPETAGFDGKTGSFVSLGQIRATTLPEDINAGHGLVVLTPWFSYPAEDIALKEEIFQKTRKIKSLVTDYFMTRTQQELLAQGEPAVKQELVKQINAELALGAIINLYFDDYIFF